MKRALNRNLSSLVYIFAPFGVCISGNLTRSGRDYVVQTLDGATRVQFAHADIAAVHVNCGDAFWLIGAKIPALPWVKQVTA